MTNNGSITLNGLRSLLSFDLNSTEIKGTGAIIITPQAQGMSVGVVQDVINGSGHTIKGTGRIAISGGSSLTNNGTFSPGLSAGKIDFVGNYIQGSTGFLEIELGGTAAGTEYDQLAVSGTVTLAGKLNVSLLNGFFPSPGNIFRVVTSAGISGTLTNVASGERLNTLDGNGSFIVTYSGSEMVLSSFGPPVSGGNTALRLRYVGPAIGGDTGVVTLSLTGQSFQQGATVLLRRAGQPDIIGVVRSISADGSVMEVTFDLTEKPGADGQWW